MVAETSFVQTSSGGVAAAGRAHWSGSGGVTSAFPGMCGQSSQELSIARGITKMTRIAERLQLSAQIQEAGRRMYQLAVQMNFTCGRQTRFVASACLYVVCRRNRSPHLLIDFSDVLQAPVKVLGQVYMRLVRRLVGGDPTVPSSAQGAIEVPIVDPSIFIERFSRKLSLGSNQRKVQNTAMRLIQFMHRDWICIGRRPNGLCGAALLIAAYYHGLQCSAKDIAEVVRMQEGTIRLRLYEMQQTPLAVMDKEQFEKADVQAIEDGQRPLPPCMRSSLRREEQAAILDAERRKVEALEDAKLGGPLALGDLATASGGGSSSSMPPPPVPVGRKRRSTQAFWLDGVVASGGTSSSSAGAGSIVPLERRKRAEKYTAREPSGGDIEEIAKDIASHHSIEAILEQGGTLGTAAAGEAGAKVDALLSGRPGGDDVDLPLVQRACADGSATPVGEAGPGTPLSPEACEEGEGGIESLSDIDDDEIDMYLLDEEEQENKSDIWHEVNKDYLEEWHVRGLEAKRKKEKHQSSDAGDTASEIGSATRSQGSGSRSRRSRYPSAASPTQSAMMALSKKGKVLTNRINIEALESLFS